jgi:hypothetical protein
VYPDGIPGFGDFLCGKVKRITVRVRTIEIPKELLLGDYEGDPVFRDAMHKWVQQLWQNKDKEIQTLTKKAKSNPISVAV